MTEEICELLPTWSCTGCGLPDDGRRRRRGPDGPRTLCNRCGLRFYRKSRAANVQRLKEENILVTAVAQEYVDRLTSEQQRALQWQIYQQQVVSWVQQMRAYELAEMERRRLMTSAVPFIVPLNIETVFPPQ